MRVLPLRGLWLQEGAQRRPVFRRRVFPIGLDRVPALAQSFLIRIAVLRDQRGDPLRMTQGQSKAHWCSIVEDVKGIPPEAEDLGEPLHDLSQMIKGVFEGFPIRSIAEPKTWQVRRYHVIAVGKRRDELAIHVRGGGKAV